MNDEDHELVISVQSGRQDAFRQLVEKYKRQAYFMALDLLGSVEEAEDASQEAFIKVYNSIHRFRGDSKFSSWFYRIIVNTCLNKRRRKSFRNHESLDQQMLSSNDPIEQPCGIENDPERTTEASLLQIHITRAIDSLSHKQQVVFNLRHYQGLSIKEISQVLNCSEGTIKSQLFRAIQRLQKLLSFYKSDLG